MGSICQELIFEFVQALELPVGIFQTGIADLQLKLCLLSLRYFKIQPEQVQTNHHNGDAND